jgi:tetratricopeptide (TPR) repeat protein
MTHHRRHVGPAVVLLGALAVLAFAVPASGQTLDAWKQYQDDLARAGEKERLLSEFKQRAASEESAVNRYLLGRVYGLIEDLAKARVEFELSLEMDPDYVPSLKGLAVCHLGTREPDLAIEKLRRCRKLAPDDGDVVTMLADALGQTGKRTEALRLLEGYLQKEPEHVQSRYLLAILLFQTGEFERAEFEFRTVINLDPTRVQARSDLAHCLLQLQDYAGAIEQMRKAVELAPQFPPFRIKLSQFLANAGRYEEAREALRPLLEMELPPETKEQIGRQIKALELYAKGLIGPGAGIEDAERVGQLLELLKDEDVQIRRNAVLQLSQFVFPNGPAAADPALPPGRGPADPRRGHPDGGEQQGRPGRARAVPPPAAQDGEGRELDRPGRHRGHAARAREPGGVPGPPLGAPGREPLRPRADPPGAASAHGRAVRHRDRPR